MTASQASTGRIRVMIVDDDTWVVRGLVEGLCTADDIEIDGIAHDSVAAVDTYRQRVPDVVLMDIAMPGPRNGIDATIAIKRYDPQATVVVLTTTAPGPGLIRAIDAGACAVLSKSADEDAVVRVIRSAAAGDDPRLLIGLKRELRLRCEAHGAIGATPVLTQREREVLELICRGQTYDSIAAGLGIAVWTVRSHAQSLREKLGASSLAQLVVRALEYRFIT